MGASFIKIGLSDYLNNNPLKSIDTDFLNIGRNNNPFNSIDGISKTVYPFSSVNLWFWS